MCGLNLFQIEELGTILPTTISILIKEFLEPSMINLKAIYKSMNWTCALILVIFGSITNLNAEEIKPFPQLKEFPKLPPLPNIESVRIPEPIKAFNASTQEADKSKLIPTPLPNFDKSQLIGDWRTTQPFVAKYIGGSTKIEGITFSLLPDSSLTKEWTSEGVFYESTAKDGSRRFATSFSYKTLSNLVLLMVTFSANEIKNGVVIPFEIIGMVRNNDKSRVLKLKNENNVIEFYEVPVTQKLTFTTENKSDTAGDGLEKNSNEAVAEKDLQKNSKSSEVVIGGNSSSLEDRIKQRRLELEASQKWDGKAKSKDELLNQAKDAKSGVAKSCGSSIPRLTSDNLAIQEVMTEDLKQKILESHQAFLQKKINQPKSAERFNELKKEVEGARGFYNKNISNHCAIGPRMIEGLNKAEVETKLLINLMNNFVADLNTR